MSKGFASNFRMTLLAACVLACFLGVGVRLTFLHVINRDDMLKYVNKARHQIVVEHARRGAILDTKGDLLATSRSFMMVGVDPELMHPDDAKAWPELARLLKTPSAGLSALLQQSMNTGHQALVNSLNPALENKRVRWVKLAEEVDEDVYDQITKLKVRGVYGARTFKRIYPGNELAAHVIGYVNKEGVAVTGAEHHLDIYLKGEELKKSDSKDRRVEVFKLAGLFTLYLKEIAAHDGWNAVKNERLRIPITYKIVMTPSRSLLNLLKDGYYQEEETASEEDEE